MYPAGQVKGKLGNRPPEWGPYFETAKRDTSLESVTPKGPETNDFPLSLKDDSPFPQREGATHFFRLVERGTKSKAAILGVQAPILTHTQFTLCLWPGWQSTPQVNKDTNKPWRAFRIWVLLGFTAGYLEDQQANKPFVENSFGIDSRLLPLRPSRKRRSWPADGKIRQGAKAKAGVGLGVLTWYFLGLDHLGGGANTKFELALANPLRT